MLLIVTVFLPSTVLLIMMLLSKSVQTLQSAFSTFCLDLYCIRPNSKARNPSAVEGACCVYVRSFASGIHLACIHTNRSSIPHGADEQ